MTRLSAIVPATDLPPTLARCLDSLRRATEPPDELIVVDGPGLDAAEARNEGARRATGELLLFVDADVLVHADALRLVRARFADNPELDALFGAYDDRPEAPGLVSRFRNLLHHYVHQSSAGPTGTFWAGLGAIRAEAFSGSGGFRSDPFPLPALEDVELGMRLAASGAEIELDPRVQGTHLKRWTLRTMVWTDFWGRGMPWTVHLLRARRSSRALNLGRRHRASAGLALVATTALLRRRPLAAGACAIGLVALNRPFYGLLALRLGRARAAACVPLHALHHVVGAGSVLAGLVVWAVGPHQPTSSRPASVSSAGPSSRYSSSVFTDQTS
jgi:GT2 family glycosyltransferase